MAGRGQWKTDMPTQFGQVSSLDGEHNLLSSVSSPSGCQGCLPTPHQALSAQELKLASRPWAAQCLAPQETLPADPEELVSDRGALALQILGRGKSGLAWRNRVYYINDILYTDVRSIIIKIRTLNIQLFPWP